LLAELTAVSLDVREARTSLRSVTPPAPRRPRSRRTLRRPTSPAHWTPDAGLSGGPLQEAQLLAMLGRDGRFDDDRAQDPQEGRAWSDVRRRGRRRTPVGAGGPVLGSPRQRWRTRPTTPVPAGEDAGEAEVDSTAEPEAEGTSWRPEPVADAIGPEQRAPSAPAGGAFRCLGPERREGGRRQVSLTGREGGALRRR
jgi:hypothetical protein